MTEHTYPGGELDLFARAQRWKSYWITCVRSFIGGSVLEVGAGTGTNTLLLRNGGQRRWLCLEPDPKLTAVLTGKIAGFANGSKPEVRTGTLTSLTPTELFDTILYIDVLEHIKDDREELQLAAEHLNVGGHLVVLSPAHSWLFSQFDQAIGHFRRYTAKTLEALTPAKLRIVKSFYLDSAGLLASAANRFLLAQSLPTARQIHCWDTFMIPCSRILDPLIANRLGKSVVCVWTRPGVN